MQELSKNLYCVQIRSGVEIWVEREEAEKLQQALTVIRTSTFIHFRDESINSADIVGIFSAKTMQDHTRRKNGGWQCASGYWHEKGMTRCDCPSRDERELNERKAAAQAACDKCEHKGWLATPTGMRHCDCILPFINKKGL